MILLPKKNFGFLSRRKFEFSEPFGRLVCLSNMKTQNYQNHRRYYIPHHLIFLPLVGGLMTIGGIKSYLDVDNRLVWMLFTLLSFSLLYLGIMIRQHYALGNQNRIIRLEFRLRYLQLTGERSDEVEKKLHFSQIAALRFADDREFIILLSRALHENISANKIKKSINNWQADHMRV
jgi:hypothetical protein